MGTGLTKPLAKMSVKQQLILLFVILVSPVFVLHWYVNAKAEQILKRHVTHAYVELNKQNTLLISRDIDAVNRITRAIIQDPVTQAMNTDQPRTLQTRLSNVNKKMLEDKGVPVPSYDWTWDDMLNTAKAVADPKKGISGIAPMGKGNEAGWNWTNFLFEAGGDIQSVDGGKVTATFNSDAGVKALDFYNKLRWEANAIPQDWSLGWGDATGAFAQGRTAMVIAGAEGPLQQALQAGMKPEDVLVYPMPAAAPGGKHTGVLGGDYLVINPKATKAEQEAAFNYITFDYFSDSYLQSLEKNIQDFKAKGQYFVPPHMDYYKPDSEYGKKVQDVLAKYDNVYKYNNESNTLLDGKAEAQYSTQDYYGAMTIAIQSIFSKKDGNSKDLLDKAAKKVQTEFYDKIKLQ